MSRCQYWSFSRGSLEYADLVAQSQILQLERTARMEDRKQSYEERRLTASESRQICTIYTTAS
jgi:hypothetical protein